MRRRILPLVMLVIAAVVVYNSYSLFQMDKELKSISGKLVQVPATASAQPPLDVIVIKHSQCKVCPDLKLIVENLKSQMNIRELVEVDENTGRSLVKKYNLKKLPVVIFSPEMKEYSEIAQNWQLFGEIAEDGSYMLTKANPPFMDVESEEVQGLVSVTKVVDETCEECYDVDFHKTVLESLKIVIKDEKTVDVSSDEGQALVEKYKLESVPTIILSKEAEVYPIFIEAWKTVGSKEEDGSFVYRNNQILQGKYKNLETGKVESGSPALLEQAAP